MLSLQYRITLTLHVEDAGRVTMSGCGILLRPCKEVLHVDTLRNAWRDERHNGRLFIAMTVDF